MVDSPPGKPVKRVRSKRGKQGDAAKDKQRSQHRRRKSADASGKHHHHRKGQRKKDQVLDAKERKRQRRAEMEAFEDMIREYAGLAPKSESREWSSMILSCSNMDDPTTCGDIARCVCSSASCCCVYGYLASRLRAGMGCDCISYSMLCCAVWPCWPCWAPRLRAHYRVAHNIIGSGGGDYCAGILCPCFAATQMLRDLIKEDEEDILLDKTVRKMLREYRKFLKMKADGTLPTAEQQQLLQQGPGQQQQLSSSPVDTARSKDSKGKDKKKKHKQRKEKKVKREQRKKERAARKEKEKEKQLSGIVDAGVELQVIDDDDDDDDDVSSSSSSEPEVERVKPTHVHVPAKQPKKQQSRGGSKESLVAKDVELSSEDEADTGATEEEKKAKRLTTPRKRDVKTLPTYAQAQLGLAEAQGQLPKGRDKDYGEDIPRPLPYIAPSFQFWFDKGNWDDFHKTAAEWYSSDDSDLSDGPAAS